MSRNIFGAFVALATLAALAIFAHSHAQFGGLLKRKMKEKAIEAAIPQPSAPADTQAARRSAAETDRKTRQEAWAHPTPITAANLGNFVTAVHAEQAERAKAAASAASPLGRLTQYNTAERNCKHDLALADTISLRLQADMQKEAAAGKVDGIHAFYEKLAKNNTDHMAISQRCSALQKPTLTDAEFTLIHAEHAHEDSVGAAASGFTSLEYARLRERVIAYARSCRPAGSRRAIRPPSSRPSTHGVSRSGSSSAAISPTRVSASRSSSHFRLALTTTQKRE